MRKMRKIILTTMVVLMLFSSGGYGADWKSFGKDANNNEWFYDTQSISREQDTVKVWTKIVLSDKAKADFKRKFPNGSLPVGSEYYGNDKKKREDALEKFQNLKSQENISHRIDRYEIDCIKNRIKVMSSTWFDFAGDVMHGESTPHPLFDDITPDSTMAKLAGIVCKKGGD